MLTIYSEDKRQLSDADRPNGSRGPETISLIAPVDGFYLFNVRSLDEVSARGSYELMFITPRIAEKNDKTLITAERLTSEAEELRSSTKSVRESRTKFEQAAEIWRSLGNLYEEALALYGAGFSCFSFGDNQAAIDYLKRSLSMFTRLKNTPGEAMATTALGWPYLYLSDLESALDSFNQAYEFHRAENNVRGQGIALYGLGWVHAVKDQDQLALQKFSESLVCRRKVMDRRGEALTLTGIARIQSRLGRHSEALDSLSLALSILPKSKRDAEADILSSLGWVHKALKENQKAMSFFNAALAIRKEIGDLTGEATTRYGVSTVYRDSGRYYEAELEIEEALRIIESLRAKGANQQLRISYFASVQDYYEFYIDLLIELDHLHPSAGYAAKALHACERARARGLLDLLAESRVDLRQGVDPALLERERVNIEKLSALALQRRQHSSGKNAVTETTTDKEIYRLRNELEVTRAEIRRLNPRYAALTQVEPLTASQIQTQILDENTVLLQYVLGEKRSFLLMATTSGVVSYELPARSEIESLARQFYEASTVRNHLDSRQSVDRRSEIYLADSKANSLARDLSQILLSPVKNRLARQRLIVLTSGALQFVPFAALPIPSQSDLDSRLLIDEHELIILPSVTALSVIRQEVKTRTPPPKTVIVIGDPVFDRSDSRVRQHLAEALMSPARFPRLIGSRWEGERILSLIPREEGKLVVDFAANTNFASSGQVSSYRYVHFATHALIDFEHPEMSGIVLSMVDQHGNTQNGFLGMEDIFKLRMPVDLVVLSGCRTALGKDYAGEGLVGLTRAFMYAGASRLAVSLWHVSDKPTSELMVRFYERMLGAEKLTPTAALRAAQLDLRKDPRWRSPYFWAPFIIQGDWR